MLTSSLKLLRFGLIHPESMFPYHKKYNSQVWESDYLDPKLPNGGIEILRNFYSIDIEAYDLKFNLPQPATKGFLGMTTQILKDFVLIVRTKTKVRPNLTPNVVGVEVRCCDEVESCGSIHRDYHSLDLLGRVLLETDVNHISVGNSYAKDVYIRRIDEDLLSIFGDQTTKLFRLEVDSQLMSLL